MSLLFDLFHDRWMIAQEQQLSYFPIVASLLEAAEQGKDFNPVRDKGTHALSLFTGDDLLAIHFKTNAAEPERKNFSSGADHVREQLPGAPEGSIAVIPIKGEFMRYGNYCAWGADELAPVIRLAAESKNISGIVLDMDSGGGAERAVPPFLQAIEYAQKLGKPVVAHGDMCASAAYYVASYCDYVMADNKISSTFGSIGVMVSWPDYREHFKQKGITINDVYAPQSVKKNRSYRDILDGNMETLEGQLKISAQTFIDNVRRKRGSKFSTNEAIFQGEVFQGNDLKKHGLVDGFGDLMKSIDVAAALAEANRLNK